MTGPYMMPAGRYAVDIAALKALKSVYWGSRAGARVQNRTRRRQPCSGLPACGPTWHTES